MSQAVRLYPGYRTEPQTPENDIAEQIREINVPGACSSGSGPTSTLPRDAGIPSSLSRMSYSGLEMYCLCYTYISINRQYDVPFKDGGDIVVLIVILVHNLVIHSRMLSSFFPLALLAKAPSSTHCALMSASETICDESSSSLMFNAAHDLLEDVVQYRVLKV